MDGQQRLNTVREFIAGEFSLTGLPVLIPLNNLHYSDFPPRIKRALDRSSLSAIVLLLQGETTESTSQRLTMMEIRRFIFDRLNTGGTKLNSQEIRNALNPGVLNDSLIEISRFKLFTEVFDIPPHIESKSNDYFEYEERQKNTLFSTMRDCELVLRYFALKNDETIRGSMKSMLDRAMELKLEPEDAETIIENFKSRFEFIYNLFDGKPFRLPADEKGRVRVSAAIYDASMVAINDLWKYREEIKVDKENIQQRMKEAMKNDDQLVILTGQQNTAKAVRSRISLMRRIMLPLELTRFNGHVTSCV